MDIEAARNFAVGTKFYAAFLKLAAEFLGLLVWEIRMILYASGIHVAKVLILMVIDIKSTGSSTTYIALDN